MKMKMNNMTFSDLESLKSEIEDEMARRSQHLVAESSQAVKDIFPNFPLDSSVSELIQQAAKKGIKLDLIA